ncbi:TPA: sensor domain-containing diguanylate cyclase [Photobacterium damselae]
MEFRRKSFDGHMMDSVRIALLIIIVFSLLNFTHYYMTLRVFRDNMINTTLYRTTNYISRTMQDVNNTYTYASHTLADLYSYRIQTDYDPEGLSLELKETQKNFAVKTIGLVDIRKNLYLDNFGRVLTIDITSERDKWIQDIIDMPDDSRYYLYDPDTLEYETLYSFYYDHKIRDDNNQVIGILGVGIDYEAFYNRIQGLDEKIRMYFVTPSGEIRLPKNIKGVSAFELFPYLLTEQFYSALNHDQIIWEYRHDESFLLYLHYLKDINRILLLNMDVTDYYNQAKIRHFYSFLLGLALTIVVVIINLFVNLYKSNKLEHTAFYDSLTHCRNRNYLESQVKKNSYWQQIRLKSYSMLIFDIDHFKQVNDTYGHAEGDRVLNQVATLVRSGLRNSDEFIRLGGDEFLILLDMEAKRAINVANRINQQVGETTSVSLSVGITDILIEDSLDSAMERADAALYEAKKNGRNQVKVYSMS